MDKLQWKQWYREQRISKKEEWRPIVGYEGLYEVSSLGRIKSMNYNHTKFPKVLSPGNQNGYRFVRLSKNDIRIFLIHRLVAQAFINNPQNKKEVNHKNGIKHDNRLQNLEWNTRSENQKHRFTHLGHSVQKYNSFINNHPNKGKIGKESHSSKIIFQYDKNMNFIKLWYGSREIERSLGISYNNVISCCNGKRKTAGGFIFKY